MKGLVQTFTAAAVAAFVAAQPVIAQTRPVIPLAPRPPLFDAAKCPEDAPPDSPCDLYNQAKAGKPENLIFPFTDRETARAAVEQAIKNYRPMAVNHRLMEEKFPKDVCKTISLDILRNLKNITQQDLPAAVRRFLIAAMLTERTVSCGGFFKPDYASPRDLKTGTRPGFPDLSLDGKTVGVFSDPQRLEMARMQILQDDDILYIVGLHKYIQLDDALNNTPPKPEGFDPR